jgi:CBS domain-containing protein
MKLGDILNTKSSEIITISPNNTIKQAMDKIVEKKIGALLVMNGDIVVGIITERDIFRQIHQKGEKAFSAAVRDIMTQNLVVGVPDDDVDLAMAMMTNNRFRHLPVMDAKKLVGLISIGDLVKVQVKDIQIENRYLMDYITGKYPA